MAGGYLTIVPATFRDIGAWARTVAASVNGLIRGGPFVPVWRNLSAPMHAARIDATAPPTWAAFRSGVYAYSFSASATNEAWGALQIGHDYARGTVMYPHIHWATTADATGVVRWGFEYSLARGHGQDVFPTATTVYVESTASAAFAHNVSEVATASAIDGATVSIEPDTLLLFRLFRDGAHGNDTMTAAAYGFSVDLHYQCDLRGTAQKAPDFYT